MKLSKKGEVNKKTRIVELTKKLKELQANSPENFDKQIMSYDESIIQEQDLILLMLRKEVKELETAEILEDLELPENIVTIGDTITILTKLNDEPEEKETIALVEEFSPEENDSVTINSPLGSALYLQSVGSTITCEIPAGILQIKIIEKSKSFGR